MGQHSLHLAGADHAGLVDHQHITWSKLVAASRPAMFEAGDGTRLDARSAFQILRRDPGQRRTADLIALALPCLAGNAQHRRLAGAGIADDRRQTVPPGDMVEGVALLAGQRKPPPLCRLQRSGPLPLGHAMLATPRQVIARLFQPRLGYDHISAGEPFLVASVLAQRHQLGAGAHRRHHLIELLLAIRMPKHECREVAVRKGRLLPRDAVQRMARISNDLLTILPRDAPVILSTLGILAAIQATLSCGSDLVLRFQLNALIGIGAMVDPRLQPQLRHALVDMRRPSLAPHVQKRRGIPVAVLLPETVRPNVAHRQHDMRVRLRAAVLRLVPMHVEVRDHSPADELLGHEIAGERDALLLVHLARNRELHFTSELRILALLARLHLVPQRGAVIQTLRCALRQHHLGMNDAGLVREIVRSSQSLIGQLGSGTIGGRRDGAGAVGAADDLGAKMIDRHRNYHDARLSARWQQCISAHSRSASHLLTDLLILFVVAALPT